jgi:hypothetical protein
MDDGSTMGKGMVGCLTGETSAVASKGVYVWVLSTVSKLEKPDDGLKNGDAANAVGGFDVWSSMMSELQVDSAVDGFFTKRPELSL